MEDEKEGMSRRKDSAPSPPSPMNKSDRRHRGRLRKRDKLLRAEGGRGLGEDEPKSMRPQESLVLYT
jgi:hypothetical protein